MTLNRAFGGVARTSRSMRRYRFSRGGVLVPSPFTHTGSGGPRVNASGAIETVTGPRITRNPVPRKNLLTHSNDFTNAAWTSSPANVQAVGGRLESSNASGSPLQHQCYQLGQTIVAGQQYAGSVSAQLGEVRWLILNLFDGAEHRAYFDLATGQVGDVHAGFTARMYLDRDNPGYYRCEFEGVLTNASVNGGLSVELTTANGAATSVIPVGEGFAAKNAQFEKGPATAYIATAGAPVSVRDPIGVMVEAERIAKTTGGETPDVGYTTDGLALKVPDMAVLGPTGAPMTKLTRASGGGYCYTYPTTGYVAGQIAGRSTFLRRGTTGQAAPHFMASMYTLSPGPTVFATAYVDLDAGVIHNVTYGSARLVDWGDGLYELQQWGVPSVSGGGIVDVNILGVTDGTFHYFGCELFVDGMPTTFFAGTKAAEQLTCSSLPALGWNDDEWTASITLHEPAAVAGNYPMLLRLEGAGGSVININKQPDGQVEFAVYDGTSQYALMLPGVTAGQATKYVMGCKRDQVLRVAAQGRGFAERTVGGAMPDQGLLRLGSANGYWHINQPIAEFSIAPCLLSAAEFLQEAAA